MEDILGSAHYVERYKPEALVVVGDAVEVHLVSNSEIHLEQGFELALKPLAEQQVVGTAGVCMAHLALGCKAEKLVGFLEVAQVVLAEHHNPYKTYCRVCLSSDNLNKS